MKHLLLLSLIIVLSSCFKDADDNIVISESNAITGTYIYTDPDCNSEGLIEEDCNDYVEFFKDNTASVILRTEEFVYQTNYTLEDETIVLEKVPSTNTELSFKIKNDSTLFRLEDNTIWLKEN